DGSDQQPVGGLYLAMAVEQQEGAGGGGLERRTGTELRVGLPGLGEEPGSGFEPTGQGGADEGRLGAPSTAVGTPGAEFAGPVRRGRGPPAPDRRTRPAGHRAHRSRPARPAAATGGWRPTGPQPATRTGPAVDP